MMSLRCWGNSLRSPAHCGNVGLEHGTFKSCLEAKWKTNYSSLFNRQLPEGAVQTKLSEEAWSRLGTLGGRGATQLGCTLSRVHLSDQKGEITSTSEWSGVLGYRSQPRRHWFWGEGRTHTSADEGESEVWEEKERQVGLWWTHHFV